MKYIDMHCDTLLTIPDDGSHELLLENNKASVDFKRLKASNAMAQFFAIFLLTEEIFQILNKRVMADDEYIKNSVGILKDAVKSNSDIINMAYGYDDLIKNDKEGKISAFLTIEDGRSATSLDKVKEYYNMGIRLIGLTWNDENCMGFPNSDDKVIMSKGLKDYGKEVVKYMNDIGIIVDVSHLSDGGFYDVAKISKKPFVASHSNARSISPHKRNLTDDMLKIIGNKGGVVGLNFGPEFLNEDITNRDSKIELMVRHLNHMRNKGGENILALGSDFDGIGGNLEINSSEKMPLLFDALRKDGWTEDLIEKLTYKNLLRVIKETL